MPIYEYRCQDCRRRSSVLVRTLSEVPAPRCDHCGGRDLARLISKVSIQKFWGDSLPDTGGLGGDDGDPREMAAYLRHMRRELGGGAGPDFDQTIDELEAEAFAEEHGLGLDDNLESE
jgi:putative FmdB family regulatory protein